MAWSDRMLPGGPVQTRVAGIAQTVPTTYIQYPWAVLCPSSQQAQMQAAQLLAAMTANGQYGM
jgi:hypothetical protein